MYYTVRLLHQLRSTATSKWLQILINRRDCPNQKVVVRPHLCNAAITYFAAINKNTYLRHFYLLLLISL